MTKQKHRVLVVDDKEEVFNLLRLDLAFETHYTFELAKTHVEMRDKVLENGHAYAFILMDLQFDAAPTEEQGLNLIRRLHSDYGYRNPILVLTNHEEEQYLNGAIQQGADGYLIKSKFDGNIWRMQFDFATKYSLLLADNLQLKNRFEQLNEDRYSLIDNDFREISPNLQKFTDHHILLVGEVGTGKEMAARHVHKNSERKDAPFIVFNLTGNSAQEEDLLGLQHIGKTGQPSTLKLGQIQKAQNGTLLIEGIDKITPQASVKLRDFCEKGTYIPIHGTAPLYSQAKIIIAATTQIEVPRDILMFFKEKEAIVTIPNLSPLEPNIRALIKHFLEHFLQTKDIDLDRHFPSPNADGILKMLENYHWYGNGRHLRNCIEYMVMVKKIKKLPAFDETCLPLSFVIREKLNRMEQYYLNAVTQGHPAPPEALAHAFGLSLEILKADLRHWHQNHRLLFEEHYPSLLHLTD